MAYEISQQDQQVLQSMRDAIVARGRLFPAPQRRRRLHAGGGAVVESGVSIDIKYVLIDADITGSTEDDPTLYMLSTDITLSDAENSEGGWTKVFQDPPDDDYSKNQQTKLNLYGYTGQAVELKYFETEVFTLEGICPKDGTTTTIYLATTASNIQNIYKGDTIKIIDGPGNDQTATIIAYDGPNRKATLDTTWTTAPEKNNTKYQLSRALHRKLATTIISDTPNKRKIARYALTTVYYDAGEDFKVGTYQKTDYPGYPENDKFPPDGNGTYKKMPDTYFNRKFRAIAINGILITAFCEQLPAPELVPK